MVLKLHERVRVGVVFKEEGQKIEPKWFLWRGGKKTVKYITYVWREKEGRDTIHKFSVTDGSTLYELSYWQEKLIWFLDTVEMDG